MMPQIIDLSLYKNNLSFKNRLYRLSWYITWCIFIRIIPRNLFHTWKLFLYRLYGAKLHSTSVIYSTAKVYMPCNLEMKEYSCLGPEVDCYNVAKVYIGANSTVSQKSYLCTSSHDITKKNMPLIYSPIFVENYVWIAADVFVGMGVKICEGAVVGARSTVVKDVESWTIVAGNPAKFIKKRIIID